MRARYKIFVSYSHHDRKLFEEFKIMLAPAIQRGVVDLWDDTKITPGTKWKEEIQKALASASTAVLLVSPNFLASHFIAENELPPLLKAAQEEGVTIFWIYLRSCLFEQTEIASYQAAHDTSRPLDGLTKSQRQAVLSEVCAKLIQAAQTVAPLPSDHLAEATLQAADTQVHAVQRGADAQGDIHESGAIIISVENVKDTDDGYDILVDGETAKRKVISKNCGVLAVSPGLRQLEVTATIAGVPAHYWGVVKVEPGMTAKYMLTLAKWKD
jgi:hypothetical protein